MRVFGFLVFLAVVAVAVLGVASIVGSSPPARSEASVPLAAAVATEASVTDSTGAVALGDGAYGQTEPGKTATLRLALAAGEALVGQGYGFAGRETGCRAWLVAGPYRGEVTVTDGEWFAFAGVRLSAAQQQDLLAQVVAKQARQGYGCERGNVRVDRLGGAS
jgi:hypothetical protein